MAIYSLVRIYHKIWCIRTCYLVQYNLVERVIILCAGVRLSLHFKSKYIQMPKLADLLCQSVNNSSDFDSAWYIRFAYNLHMDVSRAQKLFSDYGLGYIYASTGFVMPDTPHLRRKMVANFGACVVVTSAGDMWLRTPEQIGAKNRKRAAKLDAITRHRIQRDEQALRECKRLKRLFEDGQERPCPRHGGKANSHADIGKYVGRYGVRIDSFEPRSTIRFAVIHVNI
ncbi:hypothetical protein M089_5256 [Bacteroides ovatus str. 3725 D9 iii]|jgi:hypothetical protein|nr:hypothetical protein M088_2329 [Bacteroides ovatus str. 3725 D1 iv]KDS19044.1 hypothetical protein M082_2772 [Bacteroides fragilis str. 3725 D9 ii]KDS21687.1 hypothetical protein M089_5256 [Bacteroides ovatus str. 3725 D9 iii]